MKQRNSAEGESVHPARSTGCTRPLSALVRNLSAAKNAFCKKEPIWMRSRWPMKD